MNEYISREETVKAFCEKCKGYYDGHCIHRVECDIDVIKTAPAADVQPVKHGRWSECYTDSVHYSGICTACKSASVRQLIEKSYEFCPRCGARMDS